MFDKNLKTSNFVFIFQFDDRICIRLKNRVYNMGIYEARTNISNIYHYVNILEQNMIFWGQTMFKPITNLFCYPFVQIYL